jgi:RHS repeat-associated protein
VLPGVTARWSAENDAVKEELVLARRDVPRVYRFDVAGSEGLQVRARADGGLEFVDAAGERAFTVPAAFAYDGRGFEAPRGTVRLDARAGGSGWQVELRVDDAWLDDPGTVFPVTVDPTIAVPSEAGDCKLDQELASTSFCSVGRLEVGWGAYGSFAHDHRSILKFDVDAMLPPGAQVTGAQLRAYLDFRESGTQDKAVRVHRVTSSWTDDASWLSRAAGAAWTSPGGDFAPQVEAQATVGAESTWYAWDVGDLVEGWMSRALPNQGLMLKDDGTQQDGSFVFASGESPESFWPYLEIAYQGGVGPGPTHQLSGGLRTPLSTDRGLTARALDGDGVASVGIWLDPDLDPTNAEAAALVTGGCPSACAAELTAQFTLPAALSEGRHTMLVRSEDGAGNVTRDRWHFHVADLGEADRSRLGLEQWFQYDSTDAGGDSNLHVNADTGNVVWHSVPIVNPGRGLSTVVNLTYNTQDHSGLLGSALGQLPIYGRGPSALTPERLPGLSYAPAGKGFSIAVSGPTRVNEPLRGVILAAAAEEATPPSAAGLKIAMTDADGTEHVFTNVAGRWVAPPGLNLHLRRYKPGGSIVSPIPDKWALTRPDGVTHFFDNLGFLTRTEDRNSNTLTYVYERVNAFDGAACAADDVIGRLVAGPPPRLCTRRLTEVVDPGGRSLTIEYESGGFLQTPLDGMLPQLPLDHAGPIGNSSRITQITDHTGREYRFEYDDEGFLTRFTEAANRSDRRVTGFDYEAPTAGLRGVGDHRFLDSVLDMRDLDGDGTVGGGEVHERTDLSYDDRPVLPLEAVRAPRRPYQLTKRSDGWKAFDWEQDSDRLEVTEQLEWRTQRRATTTHEVDDRGRPVRVTDALGTVAALTWSEDNKVTRHVRAQGTSDESATDFTYDTSSGTGMLESQTAYPSWPVTIGARTTDLVWAFGSGKHHSTEVGVNDATGTFVADLDRLENPKPNTGWDFTLDDRGNVTRVTDAKGNFARTEYDGFGRVIKEFDEIGNHVSYLDFHPTGDPRTVVDERDETWTYRYDPVGNVTTVVDPRAGTNPATTQGSPYTTTLGYDSFDRLTREHIPRLSAADPSEVDESETRFATRTRSHDRNGNLVEAVDGTGATTEIAYMEMDLPLEVREPGSASGPEITRYVYDTGDRLIGTIAPKGAGVTSPAEVEETHADECAGTDPPLAFLTRFCLDDIGRVQAEVRYSAREGDPSSLISSFAYDRRDNLVGTVDPNRNAGRTLGQAVDAAANPADQRMTYAYDKVDEQTSSTEKPTESGAQPTVWGFGYDANGNQVEVRHPRGDTIRTELTFDHRDQLIASRDPLGHLTCLQRREDGRVIAETSPRGTQHAPERCTDGDPATGYAHFTTNYDYDPAGDLLSRSIPFAPNQYGRTDAQLATWKVTYGRNAVGDPTSITDARGNAAATETERAQHRFENTFYDTGELRTTNRPSFFEVRGGMVVEREGRSANAEKSDQAGERESTLGQTDFGKVDPERLPDLLPQAGPTRLVYDGEMRLTEIHDVLGKERRLTYDAMGQVTERSWPFKPATSATETEPARPAVRIEHELAYDKHGNLTSFTDGENAQTTFGYDGYDRQVEETAPGAHASQITGDPVVTEPRVTRLRYDHNDNLRFTETPREQDDPAPGQFAFETGYDSLDRVIFEEAPDGGRHSYAYDVASNLVTETRPRGQGLTGEALESFQTRMAYDNGDRLIDSIQQVDDGGTVEELVTTLEYDADDNLTRITEPGAKSKPDDGQVSPEVRRTVFDGRGMPWKSTVGTGDDDERTSIVEYDPNGNLRRIVNPRGVNQATDNAHRSEEDGIGPATENATLLRYDAHDLLMAERMPWNSDDQRRFRRLFLRGDGVESTDNRLRRLISIVSPHTVDSDDADDEEVEDRVTRVSFRYWDTDWIRSISDKKLVDLDSNKAVESRLIENDYDRRGAQVEWKTKHHKESEAGRHITRAFWPSGELRSRTAKKPTENDEPTVRRYQYLYNRNGSLVGFNDVRDPGNANDDRLTRIARDPVERQTHVNETWTSGRDTVNTFDLAGNVRTRKTDGTIGSGGYGGEDAKTATFDYDSLDRETLMTVSPPTGANRVTTTNYWPSGRRESRTRPNGVIERRFFDTRGDISRLIRDGQSGTDGLVVYRYDGNANRDRDERGRYEFNARDQLVLWQKPGSADQDAELDSAYSGRITRYTLNGDGAIDEKSVLDDQNDTSPTLTDFEYRDERLRWAQTGNVRAYYRYDDLGNVVRVRHNVVGDANGEFPDIPDDAPAQPEGCSDVPQDVDNDETYYCYDEFERMRLSRGAGVPGTAQKDAFEYDGLDRRDARLEGSAGTRRDLSYIGTSELLSRETKAGGEKRFYDYDSVGDRQGQQVVDGAENRYRSYRKDANGSVLALEGDTGAVPTGERYDYDPYGELDAEPTDDEAEANPFRFEGFYYDSGVKSYDMHARAYRPEHGRFLNQDRYASATADLLMQADPLTQNRYAFGGGNPVNNIEFDGHKLPTNAGGSRMPAGRGKDRSRCGTACRRELHEMSLSKGEFEPARQRERAQMLANQPELKPANQPELEPIIEGEPVSFEDSVKTALEQIQQAGDPFVRDIMYGCYVQSRPGCPTEAEHEQATESLAGTFGGRGAGRGGAAKVGTSGLQGARSEAQAAVDRAIANVGPGRGPAYGSRAHAALRREADASPNLRGEVSFLGGQEVAAGTRGSIRIDLLAMQGGRPTAIFDLKTGGARLTTSRISGIRSQLPPSLRNLPIEEIRP